MDFNLRSEDEPLYIDEFLIEKPIDIFLQEIDIVLTTDFGSVFGNRKLGNGLETLLWKTTYNVSTIRSTIIKQIEENCITGSYFNWNVEFEVSKGTQKDIGILTIDIKSKENNTNLATQQYVFK